MANELPSSHRRRLERERTLGLDPTDDAAKWLEQATPTPRPAAPKAAHKSKTLHRWRQAQLRKPQ